MHKRPLAVICIFFIIGIVLARYLSDSVKFVHIFIVALILILVSFIFSRYRKISNILLFLSVASFAALLYINSSIFPANHISHFLGEEKLKTTVVGVIKSPLLARKPYFGKINSTYLFEIEGIKDNDEWLGVKGLAQIRIQTEKDYEYGDRLLVKGTINKPFQITNPNIQITNKSQLPNDQNSKQSKSDNASFRSLLHSDFNYREYLERQNIFALINTKENNVTVLAYNYKSNPILKYTYLLREKLKNQIIEKMPLETGAFMRAILLGDRSELPKDIQESFKNSGTMHILAISGLHIGIILALFLYLFRFLRIKRGLCYLFTIVILISFSMLSGGRPSVTRAVFMACVFLIGMLLGRRVDLYNSLGGACLFILIRNPKDLFNVGFQLSFMAVFFILYIVPRLMTRLKGDTNFYIKRFFYIPLAVSISAWVGTAPLILYYFKIITPVAIVSNILIIPALFIQLIGVLTFILFNWVPFLGDFLALFNNLIAQLIFSLAAYFSNLKFGHFYLS